MAMISIVKAAPCHYDAILALNEEQVQYLAPMDLQVMADIGRECDLFSVIEVDGQFAGFMMVLRDGEAYDGVNYRWFEARYENFLYIDRVVVSPKFHRMGLGKALYQAVFTHAKAMGASYVTAEVNAIPPNHTSLSFHKACGFQEVGTLEAPDKHKTVSMQCCPLETLA